MSLSTKYSPAEVEDKWYSSWMNNGFFRGKPNKDKTPYSIVIPPPNVTGILHMGHILNNTIQDILIRKARMEGKEACWVPGTDHASIATEAKVVQLLREKGISKADLSRDEFLEHAWEWKEKYGGIILEQLKKIGASCDWDRTRFTMEEKYYKAVIRVFVDFYNKGHIYRGLRMINWDCEAQTALSNEEVLYREDGEKATLYSIRYKIKESEDEWVTVATVRPETILGDSAIAVNPSDERYTHLIGKHALVPFINRPIPIIADDYVDKEFGTGCLKVTPAHDTNDYEIGQRHHLEVIDTLNADGTLNENCQVEKYTGKDRFVARKMIVKDLEEAGYLTGKEDFITKIGRSERTDSVVEPRLSLQWFINMKAISKPALDAVENDEIALYPSKFKNTYRHWMENVRDWCISRQLWWGHRIPAWYFGEDDFVVAETPEEALEIAKEKSGNKQLKLSDLRQDQDVLDTWASSWLWPMAVFDGFEGELFDKTKGKLVPPQNHDLSYFYPTDVLVTAPEILFFWVARMIIAGYEYMGDKPFKDVYLTGIVRDKQGRKMSKSLGNSPDPIELISQYGADGVRTGMLFSSPAGNDLLFDIKLCEQGRNFANKIWNAFRLVKGWTIDDQKTDFANQQAIAWFEARFNTVLLEIEDHFSKFRISDALMSVYKLIWNDFCAWYLEMIKPEFGKPIDEKTYTATIRLFENLMKILHPFMPFISEEIWQNFKERDEKDYLIVSKWPVASPVDQSIIQEAEIAFEIISQIRNIRNNKKISPKESLEVFVRTKHFARYQKFEDYVVKLANLSAFAAKQDTDDTTPAFLIKGEEFYIPLQGHANQEEELEKLQKELKYMEGFISSINKKLSNERFVNNAPSQVVDVERKKLADAEIKIESLKQSLTKLN
ncbi:MAG: valine--tRNA ligase [Cyclobacteriaceae bacterium]|nr:valine--tRNA ligase [Cyclobacteriaceae bacterium]